MGKLGHRVEKTVMICLVLVYSLAQCLYCTPPCLLNIIRSSPLSAWEPQWKHGHQAQYWLQGASWGAENTHSSDICPARLLSPVRWTHVEQSLLLRQLARAFLQHSLLLLPCSVQQPNQAVLLIILEVTGCVQVAVAVLRARWVPAPGLSQPLSWLLQPQPLASSQYLSHLLQNWLQYVCTASCCQLHSPSQTHRRHSWLQRQATACGHAQKTLVFQGVDSTLQASIRITYRSIQNTLFQRSVVCLCVYQLEGAAAHNFAKAKRCSKKSSSSCKHALGIK